jgi:hypothetical protein
MDSTFRVMSVDSTCKLEEFQVPCQPSGRSSHYVHCFIRPDDVSSCPDSRQTSIIRPDDVLLPSGHFTVSRRFCSSLIRPDVSAARPDAYQFSNGSLILSKFQEREDQSTVRKMWYPVRSHVSIRQESQFKLTVRTSDRCGPDAGASCMETADSTSTVRTFASHGPDCTHIRYENCVLKFSRQDTHPLWSGRTKPVMEITCSGRSSRPVRTRFLYRKDFSANFSKNPVA